MASSKLRRGSHNVVDVTLEDDSDTDDVGPIRAPTSALVGGRLPDNTLPSTPSKSPTRLERHTTISNNARHPVSNFANESLLASRPHHTPDPFLSNGEERPVKRPKTDSSPSAESSLNPIAFESCLKQHVFPHLSQATRALDQKTYNVSALGTKVLKLILDDEFRRQYREGNGHLPPEVESLVATRIQSLVCRYAEGTEFRIQATPATTQPTVSPRFPSILPSIENLPTDPKPAVQPPGPQPIATQPKTSILLRYQTLRTPPPRRHKKNLVTPQRLHARVRAGQWQSGRVYESKREGSPLTTHNRSFGLSSRPYLRADERCQVRAAIRNGRSIPIDPQELLQPEAFHVDLDEPEVEYLRYVARALYGKPATSTSRSRLQDIRHLLKRDAALGARIVSSHRAGYGDLKERGPTGRPSYILKRSPNDIANFLRDLFRRDVNDINARSFFVERDDVLARNEICRASKVPSLLLTREITGGRLGSSRTYQNFKTTAKSNREDYLEAQVEWTNCAGDIMTISWLSNTHFICGTTTHSDSHNQQYNKPGNLLLGSIPAITLRAYPDHRIVRPLIEHGDNALASMIESQDPWLFTSVVSSDFEPSRGLAFTSSFDNTVKIWTLSGNVMTSVGTWNHGGRVNFVLASKNASGTVATAADVPTEAVRVYHLSSSGDVSRSQFDSYSCTRVHDEDYVPSDKWAYYPAAIRWGVAPSVQHLLLIGYSPRSPTGEDHEIPEGKVETGELCLWDTVTRSQVKVNSAATQNVFEVVWHPSRACFAAATSAAQTSEKIESDTRTQIRIFELNLESGQYGAVKTLDCPAIDINELLIKPNSTLYSYVAAGCTDGKVYVWDAAASDRPMCTLKHGEPVEELLGDREQEDVGVKFMAWGTTADRLYTGSSDGVVKVWNVRHGRGVLVKDLIEVAAPITVGGFSPDHTRLVIGDGSGRVYLLALEDTESEDRKNSAAISSGFVNIKVAGRERAIRRPRPFLPHADLPLPGAGDPNPSSHVLQMGQSRAKDYLASFKLELHSDPTIGAIQGPNYAELGLYRAEAHFNDDINEPLLSKFELQQRANQVFSRTQRILSQRRLVEEVEAEGISKELEELQPQRLQNLHQRNLAQEFSVSTLDAMTRHILERERAELDADGIWLDVEASSDDDDVSS